MSEPTGNEKRENPRNAPIERFIWKEGDVEIVYDPYAEKREQESSIPKMDKPHEEGSK